MCTLRARTSRHMYARSIGYTRYTSAGSLLSAVCGSAVSHTCRYSCITKMHTYGRSTVAPRTSALMRAQESRRDYTYVYTVHIETESATNALTYDGLLLRETAGAARRSELGTYVRTYMCLLVSRVQERGEAIGREATQTRLSRTNFFKFRTTT